MSTRIGITTPAKNTPNSIAIRELAHYSGSEKGSRSRAVSSGVAHDEPILQGPEGQRKDW